MHDRNHAGYGMQSEDGAGDEGGKRGGTEGEGGREAMGGTRNTRRGGREEEGEIGGRPPPPLPMHSFGIQILGHCACARWMHTCMHASGRDGT